MARSKVNDEKGSSVYKKMFPDIQLESKPRLPAGNVVRVLKEKSSFEKG